MLNRYNLNVADIFVIYLLGVFIAKLIWQPIF